MGSKLNNGILRFKDMVAALALTVVACNVNTCCALFAYQPELPKKAGQFKKFR